MVRSGDDPLIKQWRAQRELRDEASRSRKHERIQAARWAELAELRRIYAEG